VPDSDEARGGEGLPGALSRLGASILALLNSRIELVTIEFEEERERTKELLIAVICGVLLSLLALVFASFFVIAYFWDTNRLAAIGAVTLLYAALGALAFARIKQRARARPAPFAATLAEFNKDAAALRRKP
jgi:uncharacterized membrane protein YqjE